MNDKWRVQTSFRVVWFNLSLMSHQKAPHHFLPSQFWEDYRVQIYNRRHPFNIIPDAADFRRGLVPALRNLALDVAGIRLRSSP